MGILDEYQQVPIEQATGLKPKPLKGILDDYQQVPMEEALDYVPAGSTPLKPIDEQHPDLSLGHRFFIKNTGANPEVGQRVLENLGYEVVPQGGFNYAVRKSPDDPWHVLDESNFNWRDLLDIASDVDITAHDIAGGIGGFMVGGIPGAIAGSAAAGGAASARHQLLVPWLAEKLAPEQFEGLTPTAGEAAGRIGFEAALSGAGEGAGFLLGGAFRGGKALLGRGGRRAAQEAAEAAAEREGLEEVARGQASQIAQDAAEATPAGLRPPEIPEAPIAPRETVPLSELEARARAAQDADMEISRAWDDLWRGPDADDVGPPPGGAPPGSGGGGGGLPVPPRPIAPPPETTVAPRQLDMEWPSIGDRVRGRAPEAADPEAELAEYLLGRQPPGPPQPVRPGPPPGPPARVPTPEEHIPALGRPAARPTAGPQAPPVPEPPVPPQVVRPAPEPPAAPAMPPIDELPTEMPVVRGFGLTDPEIDQLRRMGVEPGAVTTPPARALPAPEAPPVKPEPPAVKAAPEPVAPTRAAPESVPRSREAVDQAIQASVTDEVSRVGYRSTAYRGTLADLRAAVPEEELRRLAAEKGIDLPKKLRKKDWSAVMEGDDLPIREARYVQRPAALRHSDLDDMAEDQLRTVSEHWGVDLAGANSRDEMLERLRAARPPLPPEAKGVAPSARQPGRVWDLDTHWWRTLPLDRVDWIESGGRRVEFSAGKEAAETAAVAKKGLDVEPVKPVRAEPEPSAEDPLEAPGLTPKEEPAPKIEEPKRDVKMPAKRKGYVPRDPEVARQDAMAKARRDREKAAIAAAKKTKPAKKTPAARKPASSSKAQPKPQGRTKEALLKAKQVAKEKDDIVTRLGRARQAKDDQEVRYLVKELADFMRREEGDEVADRYLARQAEMGIEPKARPESGPPSAEKIGEEIEAKQARKASRAKKALEREQRDRAESEVKEAARREAAEEAAEKKSRAAAALERTKGRSEWAKVSKQLKEAEDTANKVRQKIHDKPKSVTEEELQALEKAQTAIPVLRARLKELDEFAEPEARQVDMLASGAMRTKEGTQLDFLEAGTPKAGAKVATRGPKAAEAGIAEVNPAKPGAKVEAVSDVDGAHGDVVFDGSTVRDFDLPISRLVEVDTKKLEVDPGEYQFRRKVNKQGVEEDRLIQDEGFDKDPINPVVAVLDKSGKLWVVDGHHRHEFAKRIGEPTMLAQIVREADGWTPAKLKAYGAIQNIRGLNGKQEDFAIFFRHAGDMGEDQARRKGLLRTAELRDAWLLGRNSGDRLFEAFIDGQVDVKRAVAIAKGAGGDEAIEEIGIREVIDASRPLRPDDLEGYVVSMKRLVADMGEKSGPGETQLDFFKTKAFQDADREAHAIRKVAKKISEDVAEEYRAIKGASKSKKRAEIAARYGVHVEDQEATKALVKELEAESRKWKSNAWGLRTPEGFEMMVRLRDEAGLPPEPRPSWAGPEPKPKAEPPKVEAPAKPESEGPFPKLPEADLAAARGGKQPYPDMGHPADDWTKEWEELVETGETHIRGRRIQVFRDPEKGNHGFFVDGMPPETRGGAGSLKQARISALKYADARAPFDSATAGPRPTAPTPGESSKYGAIPLDDATKARHDVARAKREAEALAKLKEQPEDFSAVDALKEAGKRATAAKLRGEGVTAVTREGTSKVAREEFDKLWPEHQHDNLVPIHALRASVRERLGDEAAGHEVFDQAVLDLWRNKQGVTPVPISDLSQASKQQLADSIPGPGGTFFYLEKNAARRGVDASTGASLASEAAEGVPKRAAPKETSKAKKALNKAKGIPETIDDAGKRATAAKLRGEGVTAGTGRTAGYMTNGKWWSRPGTFDDKVATNLESRAIGEAEDVDLAWRQAITVTSKQGAEGTWVSGAKEIDGVAALELKPKSGDGPSVFFEASVIGPLWKKAQGQRIVVHSPREPAVIYRGATSAQLPHGEPVALVMPMPFKGKRAAKWTTTPLDTGDAGKGGPLGFPGKMSGDEPLGRLPEQPAAESTGDAALNETLESFARSADHLDEVAEKDLVDYIVENGEFVKEGGYTEAEARALLKQPADPDSNYANKAGEIRDMIEQVASSELAEDGGMKPGALFYPGRMGDEPMGDAMLGAPPDPIGGIFGGIGATTRPAVNKSRGRRALDRAKGKAKFEAKTKAARPKKAEEPMGESRTADVLDKASDVMSTPMRALQKLTGGRPWMARFAALIFGGPKAAALVSGGDIAGSTIKTQVSNRLRRAAAKKGRVKGSSDFKSLEGKPDVAEKVEKLSNMNPQSAAFRAAWTLYWRDKRFRNWVQKEAG